MCFICGRRWSANRRKMNVMNRKSGSRRKNVIRRSKSRMNGTRMNSCFRKNSCWSCWKRSCWNGSYRKSSFPSFWFRKKCSCWKIRWNDSFRLKSCCAIRNRCGSCWKRSLWKHFRNCFWKRLRKSFWTPRRTYSGTMFPR